MNNAELIKYVRCCADIERHACKKCPFQYIQCVDASFIEVMRQIYGMIDSQWKTEDDDKHKDA